MLPDVGLKCLGSINRCLYFFFLVAIFLATIFLATLLLAAFFAAATKMGPEAPGTSIFCLLFEPMTSIPLVPVMPASGSETVYGATAGKQKPGTDPTTSMPQKSGRRT